MTSDRPYRDGLETETAFMELENNASIEIKTSDIKHVAYLYSSKKQS